MPYKVENIDLSNMTNKKVNWHRDCHPLSDDSFSLVEFAWDK